MKGNIVELRLWDRSFGNKVADWYESGKYPMYFRTLPCPPQDRTAFENYPQLVGHLVYGIFTKELGLVGLVDAYGFDLNARTGGVGIMIDEQYQKMGIASDCFITFGKYMFQTRNLRKVSMEFSGSDERIKGIMNKFATLFSEHIKPEDALERNPLFEGRFKKEMIVNGKYVDIIRVGGFKNQFDKILEKLSGA